MSTSMLIRTFTSISVVVALTSCNANDSPETLQGEPVIAGSDPNAFVRTIDESDYPAVVLTAEKGAVGIGVFQPQTGGPVLTMRDDDSDGVFDLLTYSALSESGRDSCGCRRLQYGWAA